MQNNTYKSAYLSLIGEISDIIDILLLDSDYSESGLAVFLLKTALDEAEDFIISD